ncbi:MAG: hypothetical protein NC400_07180 [Clostridium sp.]|nr:hypothetical protein [Clostridium sp.]
MRKKVICGMMVIFSVMFITGCGNKIPELSEAEQDLVVEYAANTLLKYDKYYEKKLIELTVEQEMIYDQLQATRAEEEKAAENKEPAESTMEPDSEVSIIDNTGEAVSQNISIKDFLKLDSVDIAYAGFEASEVYPEQGEDLFFIMNATNGNELLVLKFLAKNESGTEANLDIAGTQTRFKIVVNGVEKNALTTMLLNDMAYYQGTIASGEEVELVLVCEVPKEQAEQIDDLGLVMKNVDNEATISLN